VLGSTTGIVVKKRWMGLRIDQRLLYPKKRTAGGGSRGLESIATAVRDKFRASRRYILITAQ